MPGSVPGMVQARVGEIAIEYEVSGAGEPLLLVMGLGGQLTSWPEPFIDALVGRGFQVIRFDNRDAGLSSQGTSEPMPIWRQILSAFVRRLARSEYLLADMADDAFGLLDTLGIDRAHVVGVSMGGMIAQSMAIGRPERVLSLTSIMSTTGNPRAGRISWRLIPKIRRIMRSDESSFVDRQVELFGVISGPSFDPVEARARIEAGYRRAYRPAGMARQTAAIMASPDRTNALRSLRMPTLVIHGLADLLVGPSGGIATANAVPGARVLMFPDMGHDVPANRVGECVEAIADNAARALTPVDVSAIAR